ncbi:uncharacterized protein LOC127246005 isoform X2 [Andrographis paniculata]|uniref:uncharacterized protein LOC127246005 isoform X2 n=1 Tax=Andrographis paniculata TaxID=175694 RepID=UPI0021E89BC4|nr:uncharacterized protein LOC127246005 isoform X2 [Andrographis paniculata]
MRGRVQREVWSCRNLRTSSQHMHSALPLVTSENSVAVSSNNQSVPASITRVSSDSFFKDGRKISVGDCALFEPPQDSPPFIGLIRRFAESKDNNLLLSVNWLYRPAEIKLGKGFVVEGVGLPAGTASFVCRRVYDITNKRLWWLTDQDYINERQEEVDQLLHKTREEMHATLQPDGRSPKQVHGPTSTSQLKPASDSGQNSGASSHSQVKGKKRERGDHAEPVKRDRNLRSDDGDSFSNKIDNLKSEITKITEKGGLVELEGVEKLVQLMQPDRTEKKLDLGSRSILAGVIAATDNVDCLNWFVQLRGLPVLDEWLQDVHKGKIGDGNGLKVSDKSVEEFLVVLLRALDKVPVNLQALQTCNIGRSVNHLRSHKNLEIQKKARSLVDTWKKRVEAEMISIDAKNTTSHGPVWPPKSRIPDAPHSGNRTPTGSDPSPKGLVSQNSASKIPSARSPHGDSNMKSATSSPGHAKSSSPSSGKESLPRISVGGTPDSPVVREDRSSSSNQSHNCTHSVPVKEEGKSSAVAPVTGNKMSGSSTRSRKASGFPGSPATGSQKEITSTRSSSTQKSTASEKLSHPSLSSEKEKALEGPQTEGASGNKVIVKIPFRVRSPAHGAVGESLEDSSTVNSQVSSPVHPDKQEQFHRPSEDKRETHRDNVGSGMNMNTWKNDDVKDAVTGSAEGAISPAPLPDEEQSMTTEDSVRLSEAPSTNQVKSGKLHPSSFSPMNALIESCVKYSEANTPYIEDDGGMDLLASVATGEMSRSGLVSPADSTEQGTPAVQEVGDEVKSKPCPENNAEGVQIQFGNDAESKDKKPAVSDGGSWSDNGLHLSKDALPGYSGDRKCAASKSSEELVGEGNRQFDSSMDAEGKADVKMEMKEKLNLKTGTSLAPSALAEKVRGGEPNEGLQGVNGTSCSAASDNIVNCKSGGGNFMIRQEKAIVDTLEEGKTVAGDVASDLSSHREQKDDTNEGQEARSLQHTITSEFAERANDEKLKSVLEASDHAKDEERNENDSKNSLGKSDKLKLEMEVDGKAASEVHSSVSLCYSSNELKNHQKEVSGENKVVLEHISVSEMVGTTEREDLKDKTKGTRPVNKQPDEADGHPSSAAATTSDVDVKMKFDLNEGVVSDEGKFGEPVNLLSSDTATVQMINSLAFPVNSTPSGHTASITIAAAAKGSFVPPEVLRNKGELGWKGSAATSAFRPAEPRKALEISSSSANISCPEASSSKSGRFPLDIDLNVPDETALEEMASQDAAFAVASTTNFTSNRALLSNDAPGSSTTVRGSSGGLDLDLNRVDEASDNGICSTSGIYKGEAPAVHVKPSGSLPCGDTRRDFDLNDGPGVDEACVEPFSINHQIKGVMPPQLSSMGLRMNTAGQGSFSSWFPAGNTYSTIAVPSMLPDRGEHTLPAYPQAATQRPYAPSEVTAFAPDVFRGSVLSSSPAVSFPSSSFPYPVFPFGTSFPLPSASFSVGAAPYPDSSSGPRLFAPPVHSQLLGPVGSVSSQFQRPYMVSLPDSSNHGLENNRKWGRQGLDLNAGPGAVESEVREEMFSLSSAQHSAANSQALAEDQARIYSVTSGVMKRKEPEGGWENENFRYKQPSWQ